VDIHTDRRTHKEEGDLFSLRKTVTYANTGIKENIRNLEFYSEPKLIFPGRFSVLFLGITRDMVT
jgi:hypothetical protein